MSYIYQQYFCVYDLIVFNKEFCGFRAFSTDLMCLLTARGRGGGEGIGEGEGGREGGGGRRALVEKICLFGGDL